MANPISQKINKFSGLQFHCQPMKTSKNKKKKIIKNGERVQLNLQTNILNFLFRYIIYQLFLIFFFTNGSVFLED